MAIVVNESGDLLTTMFVDVASWPANDAANAVANGSADVAAKGGGELAGGYLMNSTDLSMSGCM